jgi:fatty acid desaturase
MQANPSAQDGARDSAPRAAAGFIEDYSASFTRIRAQLVDSRGVHFDDFLGQLTPRYGRIYCDLSVGAAAVIGSVTLVCAAQSLGISPLFLVPPGAVLIGFCLFYLMSFIHEGVHWNLAPDRTTNDLICKTLSSCMMGVHIDVWRRHHFEHHRSLGTIHDTEVTYFFPLNIIAILKSASGVRAIEALVAYVRRSGGLSRRNPRSGALGRSGADPRVWIGLFAGIASHGLIVAALWMAGWTAASVAWVLAIGAVAPVLNTIRQVLEHRSPDARSDVDYTTMDQGACTRLFGAGWLDSLFGSAGANRHLLHHWEPQVSYTRLADLERFLADTPARMIMERRRTTYLKAFSELMSA